jgi:diguanylate cyclase (GGDEF)-like protein/PAS domain S-box-containing protein
MERAQKYSGHIWLPIILLFVFWAEWSGRLDGLQNALTEQRMELYERSASQDIVYLTIDKKSLDQVGIWPWPRSMTAEIVRKLVADDVANIVLDLDFSSSSSADEDAQLSRALELAGGKVILPIPRQSLETDGGYRDPSATLPIPIIRDQARLAFLNVPRDRDGVARALPFEQMLEGRFIPSVATALSGAFEEPGSHLVIDYAISPGSVPTYSAVDLINGDIEPQLLRGKSVVLGAHAVQPGETYIVPVHGMLPGSLLQILAAETLLQDRSLVQIPATPILLSFALVLFGLARSQRFSELSPQLIICFALAALLAISGFFLQKRFAIVLPTAPTQMLLWLYAVSRSLNELTIRRWRFLQTSIEASNMRHMLTHIISDSSDAILVVDEHGAVLETSRKAPEIFGFDCKSTSPIQLSRIVPGELVARTQDSIRTMKSGQPEAATGSNPKFLELQSGRSVEYTITPSCLSGRRGGRRKATQNWYVACITARDVTEKRHQEARLEYMSRFDELTGAMRRSEFLSRLDRSIIRQTSDTGTNQVVFALNLHRFKTINATLGRSVGDALLNAIVKRLDGCELRLSPVARLGGDIFALNSLEPVSDARAKEISRQLAEIVETPFDLDGVRAQVGVRIGVSPVQLDSLSPAATSLAQAELALDDATRTGGSSAVAFDPHSFANQERAREIEQELWSALERREIHIAYQPQVTLSDGKLVGAEALVRWKHPRLGSISPVEFIEIAEANGFVEKLGRWILHRACEDALTWPSHVSVSVNVSPLQFARGGFVEDVKEALGGSGLPPKRLHLEITESAFIESSDELMKTLHELRALGISFALDDFGTGFSSFGYLSKFPLDAIKLDQMFVRNLTSENASQAIVQSIKTLADGMGLTLICEGIETDEQLAFLRLLGCQQGQGYLFGKPKAASDIGQISETGSSASAERKTTAKQKQSAAPVA